MILFQDDFVKQGAFADITTKNTSFIRMAFLLKRMGIRNNKFMLALYNKDLQGVDPHNVPEHDIELKAAIAAECKCNYWYFIRECVRIPIPGKLEPGYFIANRANIALAWVMLTLTHAFLTMPRQIGKTIAAITYSAWLMYIAGNRINLGLFTRNTGLVQENVDRLKSIRDSLPRWMLDIRPSDTENKEGLSYEILTTKYLTYVPQSSKTKSMGMARGDSLALEHWDEFPYFTNNQLAYPSALAATDAAQPAAREAGLPVANMITTTAGRLDVESGQYAFQIKSKAMPFTEHLYDITDIATLKESISLNSENGMLYLEFNHRQLGKDDKWLEAKRAECTSPEMFQTDYLNIWIHGGAGIEIFGADILKQLVTSKREPYACTSIEGLMLRWYRDPASVTTLTPIVMGMDTSNNIGRDATTLVAIDPKTMATIFTCRGNTANLMYVARCVIKLLEMYSRLLFIPERNANGAFLIDAILDNIVETGKPLNPFRRIYNTVVQSWLDKLPEERIDIDSVIPVHGVLRKCFGFNTTASASSRPMLMKTVMMEAVPRNIDKIADSFIIDEITTLEVDANGRVNHMDGKHDDTLIAWLLTCWLLMYGKNLHMYGLNEDDVLSEVSDTGTVVDMDEKKLQKMYVARLTQIEEQLRNKNILPTVGKSLEAEKRYLTHLINPDIVGADVFSVAQMIREEKPELKKSALDFSTEQGLAILARL